MLFLRTGQLKASHFDCSNSCGSVTAPSFPLCKKRNFHWSLWSAGQTVSLVTRFMQQHHMTAYHLASGTAKINKPMNKCNQKKTTFCLPLLVLNSNAWFIATGEGRGGGIWKAVHLEPSQQGGQTERPIQYFKFFLETSSLGLGGRTKGGIDVGEEGSFVLCPAELAEETRLSQDSIQNANGGPSCTWAPDSKCFIGTVAVLSCTQELQEKSLFCMARWHLKREGVKILSFTFRFFSWLLLTVDASRNRKSVVVFLAWLKCILRLSQRLKECKSRLKCLVRDEGISNTKK